MMKNGLLSLLSRYSAILLAVIALSYALPAGFDKVFVREAGNPLLFFSPLQNQFIYRESLGGHQFNYLNEQGIAFDRKGFEGQLPFLYYKNLEKQQLLPVTVKGKDFDKEAIKAAKQGLEIKSRHLNGYHSQIELYPLFNNDPQVAIMPFPEDVFRFTDQAMEFINADYNRVDPELTERFTTALKKQGFIFPATVIGGKTTNLKPFDEGFFIRDSNGQVFHLKRVLDQPVVVKTPIDPSLDIQDIIISENRRKEFYGTIITRQGDLYLVAYENYRLIPLPVDNYQPENMDFKLLINPLYRTVVVSDANKVYGTVLDIAYQPLRSYELERHNPTSLLIRVVRDLLFPFQVRFESPYRGQADLRLEFGGIWSLFGVALALAVFFFLLYRKKGRFSLGLINKGEAALVFVTGFLGLVALYFITED